MSTRYTLPVATRDREGIDSRKILEDEGVIFGEILEDDPMFQNVEFPKGWMMIPKGDPMWTDLIDEQGNKRASIFYNPSPLRRDAYYKVSV